MNVSDLLLICPTGKCFRRGLITFVPASYVPYLFSFLRLGWGLFGLSFRLQLSAVLLSPRGRRQLGSDQFRF